LRQDAIGTPQTVKEARLELQRKLPSNTICGPKQTRLFDVHYPGSTSTLPAGYREPKARLHNQTKNVKIPSSPPWCARFVTSEIRGENLSKVVVSHENENEELDHLRSALGSIADDAVWVARHTTERQPSN
jgi:hypothetical protein